MGILPLEFAAGQSAASLGLTGEESFSVPSLEDAIASRKATVRAQGTDGSTREFSAIVRIDTPQEREYYRHGGILPFVVRQLLKSQA
jgi:aconitate hydratase